MACARFAVQEAIIRDAIHFQRRGQPPCPSHAGYRDDDWFYILGETWNIIHAEHLPSREAHRPWHAGYLVRGDVQNLKNKCSGWVDGARVPTR
jgi:hypothetical protein